MGFVYFVLAPSVRRIKIGFTDESPEIRLNALRTASPVALERLALIAGSLEFEKLLHARFRRHRTHLEWFRANPELTAFILEYAAPWVEAIRHPSHLPDRNHAAAVIAADPWFLDEADRLGHGDGKSPGARKMLKLLMAFPETRSASFPDPELSETITIRFAGGSFNGLVERLPRRGLRGYLRKGIAIVRGPDELHYRLAESADPYSEIFEASYMMTTSSGV